MPDGIYFRHGPVYVTNGIKTVHTGIIGEENVNRLMNEFINFYNSNNDIYVRMILCHFMFEYIHPFYDGNGRLGRFLFSSGLFLKTKNYFAFTISISLLHEKNKYYKAFNEANDRYEFGCLNSYVKTILEILINQVNILIKKLYLEKNKLNSLKYDFKMTKSEEKILKLISEASLFSCFGVSNEEIIKETNVSKRTLISTLNKLKKENLLVDTKIGKFDYHKVKRHRTEFLYYVLISLVGLGLNALLMWVFTDKLGIWFMVSKLVAAALTLFYNFFARKLLLHTR